MARPGRWRRYVVRPMIWALALIALAIAGLALFLRTDLAREKVRALVASSLSEAIGRPVLIAGAQFELFPFSIVLTDVVVPGDRPLAPAFLKVRRLLVEGEFEGIGAPVLELRRIAATGVDVVIERRRDGDNVPRLKRADRRGRGLTVHIGGVTVDDARVTVAERTLPLRLEARSVLARFSGLGGTELEGSVAAQEVTAILPSAQPTGFAFSAKARLLDDHLEISNARVSAPDVSMRASGQVRWHEELAVDLTVTADGSGAFLDRLGYLDGQIRGPVSAEGTLTWRPEQWGWRARIRSSRLDILGFPIEQLEGVGRGGADQASFDLERGRFASGDATGSFEVEIEGPRYPARLDVELTGADLDALLDRFEVPASGFAAAASGHFLYAFQLGDSSVGEGSGELEVTPRARPGNRIGAAGRVPLRIVDGVVELPGFELTTPGQEIFGSLRYEPAARRGRIDARIRSTDLGELARLVPALEPGASWTPVAGSGEILLGIDLTADGSRTELGLELASVATSALSAQTASGRLTLTGDAVEDLDLELRRGAARLRLAGRLPLGATDDGLDLVLVAEGWPLADAGPWLPFELPFDGALQGRLRLTGGVEALRGELLASVEPVRFSELDARRLDLVLDWDPERVRIERATLVSEAGELTAQGSFDPETGAIDVSLSSEGLDLALPPFASFTSDNVGGVLRVRSRIGGTLEAPAIELDGSVAGLALGGRAVAEADSPISLRLADGRVRFDATLAGLATLTGEGRFDPRGASSAEAVIRSDWIERMVEIGTGERVEGLSGSLTANLSLSVDPETGAAATVEIPQLEFRLDERTIRSLEPVRVRLDAGGARIESLYLGLPGSEDELFVSGVIASGGPDALDLNVQINLAASWFEPFVGDLGLGGRVEGLASVRGALDQPRVNGQASWSSGRFVPPVVPHSFERLRALVLLYPDAVVLDRLDADFAGGTVAAKGRIELTGEAVPGSYRFEIAAREVAPRWPAGWQLRGDADLVFGSSEEGRSLRGEVTLDRAWYLRDVKLSPAQLIQRLLARSRVDVGETDEFLSTTGLNLAVRAPDAVRIRNNVARLGGSADLVVRGTLARPVVFGEIEADSGGTVTYGGNTYTIDRGRMTFANPSRIDPLLDVVARTRVDEYDVALNLSGSLERLNTTFSADPPLPDLDILGLLATGAPVSRAAFSDVAPTTNGLGEAVSAEALLYGQAASLLTERVGRLFGLDQVRVQPLTSGDTISEARVTVGKRLSSRLFVTYSLDPSSTAQQILQVEWRVSRGLVLVLTQNGNESYAVDARWENRF